MNCVLLSVHACALLEKGYNMSKTVEELNPYYDSRKSFYGKAKVIYDHDNDTITLRSYDTDVCRIVNKYNGFIFQRLWGGYSATTMRHINEFVEQFTTRSFSEKSGGKKWWDSLKVVTL